MVLIKGHYLQTGTSRLWMDVIKGGTPTDLDMCGDTYEFEMFILKIETDFWWILSDEQVSKESESSIGLSVKLPKKWDNPRGRI